MYIMAKIKYSLIYDPSLLGERIDSNLDRFHQILEKDWVSNPDKLGDFFKKAWCIVWTKVVQH